MRLMKERGYSLGNLDATIIAEVHFPQKYFCHKAFVIAFMFDRLFAGQPGRHHHRRGTNVNVHNTVHDPAVQHLVGESAARRTLL